MRSVELLAQLAEAESRLGILVEESRARARRATSDSALDGLAGELEEAEQTLRRDSSSLRQLELEVSGIRERASSHERALYDGSVRNPTDLQRRQHELDSLRAQISSLEDRQLEQMEIVEADQGELVRLRSAVEQRRQELAAIRLSDQERSPDQAAEVDSARVEIEDLTSQIPDPVLRVYRRVALRRQPAIARVSGGTCSGCRLPLPHRILEELRGDQLVTCENCERILLL